MAVIASSASEYANRASLWFLDVSNGFEDVRQGICDQVNDCDEGCYTAYRIQQIVQPASYSHEANVYAMDASNRRIDAASSAPDGQSSGLTASHYVTDSANSDRPVIWAKVFGDRLKIYSDGNAPGIESTSGGIMIGGDVLASEHAIVGIAAGYSRSAIATDTMGGTSYADSFHAGLYGKWGATAPLSAGAGLSGSFACPPVRLRDL